MKRIVAGLLVAALLLITGMEFMMSDVMKAEESGISSLQEEEETKALGEETQEDESIEETLQESDEEPSDEVDENAAVSDDEEATDENEELQDSEGNSDDTELKTDDETAPETEAEPETEKEGEVVAKTEVKTEIDRTTDPKEDAVAVANEDKNEQAETTPQTAKIANSGQVDVYIAPALAMGKDTTFTVSLSGQANKQIVTSGDLNNAAYEGVTFENLAAGTYTLSVSAPGFAGYTQEINVEDWAYSVKLTTGFIQGYDYEKGNHPGIVLLGDVNKDGAIAEDDKDILVNAVDGTNSADALTDLNFDGNVDLVDLEYFVKGYQVANTITSTLEISVPEVILAVTNDNGTKVDGDLADLSKSENSVTLSRIDGSDISSTTPVSLDFDFKDETNFPIRGMVIDPEDHNPITSAGVTITYVEDGEEKTIDVPFGEGVDFLLVAEEVQVSQDGSGTICIDFGSQIAVKKVTLIIQGTKNNNLAEISRVEFLNNMENRIPEPQMSIPQNLAAAIGSKTFTLTWNACQNVTGYEVVIEHDGKQESITTNGTMLVVRSFDGKDLVNNENYTVKVQSVNGAWHSGYSSAITATPKASKKPDAPDNVKAIGKYKSISVSWKKMEDTDSYNLYYREVGTNDYQKVENITANSYTLLNLKDKATYELYVTGVNELGESNPSLIAKVETTDISPAQMPKYKLLNRSEEGKVSEHIINATAEKGNMVDSLLDIEAKTVWGTVDNNPASYYYVGSWDSGGFNELANNGVTYEFDEPYQIQTFALQEVVEGELKYSYIRVRYWDENGTSKEIPRSDISFQQRRDAEGRVYYYVHLPEVINAKKIQFGVARYLASGTVTISEVYFYHYDSLEDDIMGLYEDDLHTVLRDDVTQTTIDELRTRLNTKDPISEEYHPDKDSLEKELKTAEDILNSVLTEPVRIHNTITTNDVNRGFGGLNAWQPLGVSAAAGEKITVYVGHNTKKTGANTNLQLVATQYHAESSGFAQVVTTLKVGRNDITIPKLSTIAVESGGALYVQYTGNSANDLYAVRVSGGSAVPILDLYQVSDPSERLQRAEAYITSLDAYVANLEAEHNEVHKNSDNKQVQYDYDAQNCILGASDIMLNTMMLSLPAQQIVNGSGSGTTTQRAQRLVDSMDAMEDMMNLFYQHKGLNNNAQDKIDQFPSTHLNIRYHRMFAGAFMYASGNHIGIEWNETAGMIRAVPVQADANGKYVSGNYFGWGIAHEIGHCINQGTYAVAEITNNYFSVLAQAKDNNGSVRFLYENVYEKVTSNTKGRAANVFTQLGLYWQLHLAYDNDYNYKTYENHSDQLNSLFFARVDTYSRTPAKAPKPSGIALTLSDDKDQNLMRLACASAEKNLLEFFERWGMTPDATTIAYAGQFAKETRAIYYVNDDARVYRLEHSGSSLGTSGDVEAVGDSTSASVNVNNANQVDFQFSVKTISSDDVLGYEIVRCITANGEVEREVVGFTTGTTFSDHITTLNNRVVTYEVTVIDKYLNRSAVKTLAPIKIEHDGSIDKSFWSVTTTNIEATNIENAGSGDDNTPCGPQVEAPIMKAIDQDTNTAYSGIVKDNAEIILEFNRTHTITGFKYTINQGTPIGDYEIYVRDRENAWTKVADGTFNSNNVQTVYFGKDKIDNIAAYETSAVKLVIKTPNNTEITISELDVLGVTGDNVDFRRSDGGTVAIGKLKNDYQYGNNADDVIPAGSIVFTGSYKGNPAYNVVILYDQNGNIVGGTANDGSMKAYQTILADVPENGEIQDVYDGTWIYWLDPNSDVSNLQKVRAELYRVDNALTNEGQRMVSDSLFETMPSTLPEIQLGN